MDMGLQYEKDLFAFGKEIAFICGIQILYLDFFVNEESESRDLFS